MFGTGEPAAGACQEWRDQAESMGMSIFLCFLLQFCIAASISAWVHLVVLWQATCEHLEKKYSREHHGPLENDVPFDLDRAAKPGCPS